MIVISLASSCLEPSSNLAHLLKLPAGERAELAMALWESLSDDERDADSK